MSETKIPKRPRHKFVPPELKEVAEYAAGLRLRNPAETAQKFIACYAPEWRDSRDKPIRNWKMKFRQVWARDRVRDKQNPTVVGDWEL